MSAPQASKPYWERTAQELAAATTEFDAELVIDQFQETAPELALERPDDPPRQDVTVVRVGLEPALVEELDRVAARRGLSRAALVERGVQAVLASEGEA